MTDQPSSRPRQVPGRLLGRNARLGLVLFILYVACYAGFMVLTAFFPHLLHDRPFLGLNGAILYGFGLILVAFLLALVYMALCRPAGDTAPTPER